MISREENFKRAKFEGGIAKDTDMSLQKLRQHKFAYNGVSFPNLPNPTPTRAHDCVRNKCRGGTHYLKSWDIG